MFAAGLYDPNQIFFEGEMGFQGDEMFYPEGYPPEDMGYPPEGMGYPGEDMEYSGENMGYTGEMGYADDMAYENETGYSEEMYEGGPAGTVTTSETFDQMVPHTYYEDDQYEENSEGEGEAYCYKQKAS